jgi:uncharacterized BrkB/YihY/UPF0761 family membrane protein
VPSTGDAAAEPVGLAAAVERGRERLAAEQVRVAELIDKYHDRPVLDLALRVHQRDREAAGSIVGSALAFRLFLFFVPLTLFVVGVLGFLGRWIEPAEVNDAIGLGGTIAAYINAAMEQPTSARFIATLAGLVGMMWAGRALSKVMVSASCLAWRLPMTTKASVRLIGSVVALVAGIALVATVVNRLRRDHGLAVAGLSFLAVAAIYAVAWMALSLVLPKATRDPGAPVPGAVIVGVVLAGMQAVSQLYLAGQVGRASALYGALATSIVTMGWFFFVGRAMVFAMVVDAVVFERFGSITTFVFGLPILRLLPRKSSWIRRFFDLPDDSRR